MANDANKKKSYTKFNLYFHNSAHDDDVEWNEKKKEFRTYTNTTKQKKCTKFFFPFLKLFLFLQKIAFTVNNKIFFLNYSIFILHIDYVYVVK